VQHLESMRSDHRPILLETEWPIVSRGCGSKKFEAKWLKEDWFREVVDEAWAKANVEVSEGGVLARLSHMHSCMHGTGIYCRSRSAGYELPKESWSELWRVLYRKKMRLSRENRQH
jgi:hypothetical protein